MSLTVYETRCQLPAPNGVSSSWHPLALFKFAADVDLAIERRRGPAEPGALWLEELMPVYAAAMPPEAAAARILARRLNQRAPGGGSSRRRSPIKVLADLFREWRFRSALRKVGRA